MKRSESRKKNKRILRRILNTSWVPSNDPEWLTFVQNYAKNPVEYYNQLRQKVEADKIKNKPKREQQAKEKKERVQRLSNKQRGLNRIYEDSVAYDIILANQMMKMDIGED